MEQTITYSGEVLQCVKQGRGSYQYPGGVYSYEGSWMDGKKHGSGGKFSLIGGDTYEGDFCNGEMTGKGTKTWSDGRTYTGDFFNGEMHGKGIWKSADGKEVYEGEFMDNRREGQGYNRLSNDDTYNGSFSNHRFHGEGSYLRENSYIISSTFVKGNANGSGSIKWHKAGSYEGGISEGSMSGNGLFTAFNGSYRYHGEFIANAPNYTVQDLHLFIDKSFISDVSDKDKAAKKKESKPKKGDHAADALAHVTAGHELGKVIFLMSTNNSTMGENPGSWCVPLTVPNPCEKHRSMKVRLREFFPPDPPGKGEAIPDPDPAKELGAVMPLWHRKASFEDKSNAWERFPVSSCIRYTGGVNLLTGEEVLTEGLTESFTKDEFGVSSAKIPQTPDSSIYVSFVPASLQDAHERLSIIADYRLALDKSQPLVPTLVNNTSFDQIPILSLCNKVGGLEGKSRLELVLLKPAASVKESLETQDGGGEEKNVELLAEEPWSNCLWELRLCEEVHQTLEEECNDMDEKKEENTTGDREEEAHTEPTVLHIQKILCRWADIANFDQSTWHSVALTLQASGCESAGNVELTVDGTGRMKMDGPFEEGIAGAWLPSTDANSTTEGDEEDTVVEMVYRVGRGQHFGGFVKSLVLVGGKQVSSVQDMTSSFVEEAVEKLASVSGNNDLDEDEHRAPPDCSVVEEVEMNTCGGRGSVDGLLIPSSTPHGLYILEVLDNVDSQCLAEKSTMSVPESDSLSDGREDISQPVVTLPGEVATLCKLVPPAGSSLMRFKVAVD